MSNEPNGNKSQSEATEIHNDRIQNKNRGITKKSTKHTLPRMKQKTVDYRDKSFDDFRLMIVDPLPKLDSEESNILSRYFGISRENQSNEAIFDMV